MKEEGNVAIRMKQSSDNDTLHSIDLDTLDFKENCYES